MFVSVLEEGCVDDRVHMSMIGCGRVHAQVLGCVVGVMGVWVMRLGM